MALVVKYEKQKFTPASEGLHQAVAVDVVDVGLQKTQWGEKPKCMISWQIEEESPETNKRKVVSKFYTVSFHEKASLRKDLETWRGRKFTEDELKGFDLERLIGVNGQLQVVHHLADDGRVFGNVAALVPLGKGMTPLVAVDFVRKKDRDGQGGQVTGGTGDGGATDEDVPF